MATPTVHFAINVNINLNINDYHYDHNRLNNNAFFTTLGSWDGPAKCKSLQPLYSQLPSAIQGGDGKSQVA
jgi:hypothetical protein